MTTAQTDRFGNVKSLAFDLMGTCVDWYTSIVTTLDRLPKPPNVEYPRFASLWRQGFFDAILASFDRGEASPDIDTVHREVLEELLQSHSVGYDLWSESDRQMLVRAWHNQEGTHVGVMMGPVAEECSMA